MPHLKFKFTINVAIACHVIFFSSKLSCYSSSSFLSSSFVKKMRIIGANLLLKNGINCKYFFKVTFFKINFLKVAFFKISLIVLSIVQSLERNCRGEYQNVDTSNTKCLKDLQAYEEVEKFK